jgi:hypothetical protein
VGAASDDAARPVQQLAVQVTIRQSRGDIAHPTKQSEAHGGIYGCIMTDLNTREGLLLRLDAPHDRWDYGKLDH